MSLLQPGKDFREKQVGNIVRHRRNGTWILTSLVILLAGFLDCGISRGTEATSGERNPFALPVGIQKKAALHSKEATGSETAGKEMFPVFRVTTILISGRTKVAAINGRLMREGDELNGYRIAEISGRQVTLSKGKEKLILKMDSEVGYFFKKSKSDHQVMGLSK
jgi:hypothetical protein